MPIFRYNEQPGNYYAYLIESSGDDANDGLTPETAVATLDRLVEILNIYSGANRRTAIVIKTLIRDESISQARPYPITFIFNSTLILGDGSMRVNFNNNGDEVVNCHIKDYAAYIGTGSGEKTLTFVNSFLENVRGVNGSGNTTTHNFILYNCILKNCPDAANASGNEINVKGYIRAYNSILIGTINVGAYILKGIILRNTIVFNCTTNTTTRDIDYSCIFNSTIGTRDQSGLIAAGQNLNGISANPQFTDPTNGQYTVNQSSPCLYRGEGGEHIGIGEGFYLQANILYFQQSVINNFQLTTGRLGFIDPLDNAFIETNPIDIGQIITLESAELAAILPVVAGEFTAGPVSYSHWYPAYSAASTYHKGAGVTDSAILYRSLVDDNLNNTPASSATEWERMTWESGVSYSAGKIVQYTDNKWYKANTATSTSWVAGEWDEVVMIREWNLQVKTGRTYDECEAADWATIPYNTTPYLDLAGKGNSDDAYDTSTGAVMVFRFIAVRIDAKTIV